MKSKSHASPLQKELFSENLLIKSQKSRTQIQQDQVDSQAKSGKSKQNQQPPRNQVSGAVPSDDSGEVDR